mmetsp:Transcript_22942/g.64149  ORF Transcript_22942/g.64149 Transcript_22942/m.64149 type:complete len:239 (-) Transcript_22942:1976-2692(-)
MLQEMEHLVHLPGIRLAVALMILWLLAIHEAHGHVGVRPWEAFARWALVGRGAAPQLPAVKGAGAELGEFGVAPVLRIQEVRLHTLAHQAAVERQRQASGLAFQAHDGGRQLAMIADQHHAGRPSQHDGHDRGELRRLCYLVDEDHLIAEIRQEIAACGNGRGANHLCLLEQVHLQLIILSSPFLLLLEALLDRSLLDDPFLLLFVLLAELLLFFLLFLPHPLLFLLHAFAHLRLLSF